MENSTQSKIWLTSDLHFAHNREFLYGPRGFNSIEEHDEEIIRRWNSVVNPRDTVYILGDLILGDNEHGIECLKRLNGMKIFIHGNHDTTNRCFLYTNVAYLLDEGYATTLTYKHYHFYLSHFPTITSNLEKESLKQMTINLYGHTHQKTNFYEDRPYMYHVGMDSHDCYPVSLDEIIQHIRDKAQECKEFL